MPTAVERLVDALVELVATQTEIGRPERDVVAHRRHEQLVVGILEHDPDPSPDLLELWPGDRQSGDQDLAGRRRVDAVEVEHECGLAGAVRPEHRDALTVLDRQVDAVQRRMPVGIGERQVADLDRRRRHQHEPHHTSQAAADTAAAAAGRESAIAHSARPARCWCSTGIAPS